MIPETPLNQGPIRCHGCNKALETFDQWYLEPCNGDLATGHTMDWPEIMLLKFKTEVKA